MLALLVDHGIELFAHAARLSLPLDLGAPAGTRRVRQLYGLITGTAGTADTSRLDHRVARKLDHIRTTRIEILGPFVLRLLRDACRTGAAEPAASRLKIPCGAERSRGRRTMTIRSGV